MNLYHYVASKGPKVINETALKSIRHVGLEIVVKKTIKFGSHRSHWLSTAAIADLRARCRERHIFIIDIQLSDHIRVHEPDRNCHHGSVSEPSLLSDVPMRSRDLCTNYHPLKHHH
jgi:hypothetical protein